MNYKIETVRNGRTKRISSHCSFLNLKIYEILTKIIFDVLFFQKGIVYFEIFVYYVVVRTSYPHDTTTNLN